MRFQQLEAEWDEDNIDHIARHGVEPEEVEEIVYEDCYPSLIVRGRRRGLRETRMIVYGQTCAGRYVFAVIAPVASKRDLAYSNSAGNGAASSKEI